MSRIAEYVRQCEAKMRDIPEVKEVRLGSSYNHVTFQLFVICPKTSTAEKANELCWNYQRNYFDNKTEDDPECYLMYELLDYDTWSKVV